jgi:hypothetical protein
MPAIPPYRLRNAALAGRRSRGGAILIESVTNTHPAAS